MARLGIACLLWGLLAPAILAQDLVAWRAMYRDAKDASTVNAMAEALQAHLDTHPDDLTAQAFHATAMLMKADHAWNPLDKLALFQDWKPQLERAIAQSEGASMADLVFLRMGVQAHVPSLLDYQSDLPDDERMVRDALKAGHWKEDVVHQTFVEDFLTYLEAKHASHD